MKVAMSSLVLVAPKITSMMMTRMEILTTEDHQIITIEEVEVVVVITKEILIIGMELTLLTKVVVVLTKATEIVSLE